MIRPYFTILVLIALLFSISCRPSSTESSKAKPEGPTSNAQPNTKPSPGATAVSACRFTDAPITIDGRADEAAWQSAQLIDNFIIPWEKGDARKPKSGTRARLLWDREYLYFLADMDDGDLFADVKEHDGMTWNNDVFELFFKPADDKPGYYEFQVNALNTQFDMFVPQRDRDAWKKYAASPTFEFKSAVSLRGTLNKREDRDQGWTVEGRLRWADFSKSGGRPAPGEVWKFALCRYDYDNARKGPELSTTAPLTVGSFHHHEDYTPLKFVGPRDGRTENRPLLTGSRVVGFPDPRPAYAVEKRFANLKMFQPIYAKQEPGTGDLLVIQHLGNWAGPGRIVRVKNRDDVSSAETLLDIDYIVYGMAFHPKYLENRQVFLFSNGPVTSPAKKSRISRFVVDRATGKIDAKSELVIIEWLSDGHNGGEPAFGPDGMLYAAGGDGTSDSDGNFRGQNLSELTAACLRIDVDHPEAGKNYSVPKDNPFWNIPGARPEIWAYGLRNPWRLTYDIQTNQLWIGNNGQDLWETAYLVHKGDNFGWSLFEGSHPFIPTRKAGPTPITQPTIEHHHSEFRSLTGGVVYHGVKYPELEGAYVTGDFSTGRIWGMRHDGIKAVWHRELARTTLQITGFAIDDQGELLVLDQGQGIHRLIKDNNGGTNAAFPIRLSQTGLFASVKGHNVEPSLVPYDVNAALWSDGAAKSRFIALPGEGKIDYTASRGWNFPEGAVLVKSFALPTDPAQPGSQKYIETRLLTKTLNQWVGYSYIWNEEQTDATLVESAGRDKEYAVADAGMPGGIRKQTWHFPSRTECMVCHSRAANFVLGLTELQMNRMFDYGGGLVENQLAHLEKLGVLRVDHAGHVRGVHYGEAKSAGKTEEQANQLADAAVSTKDQRGFAATSLLPIPPARLSKLVNPYDESADLNPRARSYLHANCSICHVEAGGGNAKIDLEFGTALNKTALLDRPHHDAFKLTDARLVAPGAADRSVLLHRISIRGAGQMPPLATGMVDQKAVEMIRQWILQIRPE